MKNAMHVSGMLLLLFCAAVVHATTEWSAQDYDLYSGDFNGDGKSDILYIAKNPQLPSGIAISDSTGAPNTAWQSWASDYLGVNWSSNAYNVIVADFNGDGKADIFLQSKTPGGSCYLLLTSGAGFVVAISQTIVNGAMGLTWSADQHHIIAGDFNGDHRADLFLQATSSSGTDAVVLAGANGLFTSTSPNQTWSDGFLGFKWSAQNANVFAGDFNGDGLADLLIQAKPNFVTIAYDVPFPVPTYPPNMNGVVLAQAGPTIFTSAGAQAWSRMSNGVDWSPLTDNVIIATDASGKSDVILQSKNSGRTSYELIGNSTSTIFPSSATALSSNVSLAADSYRLIAGNYSGSGVGLYYQALTSSGTNYVADSVGATTTASVQNPTTATRTVEPTAVGRTAGRFGVSSTGSAQYSIPIWAPPGPRGVQPNISLSYDSRGGIGPLGIGWTLSGLGQIARCNLTAAQDTTPAPVALVTTDGYCINGNRLRLKSGTYGTAGSTYQTEIADFSNITANGTAGNGPAYFTVQARDGLTYQYGYTDGNGNGANSQVLANASTTALTWMLSKVIDRAGNNYVINYTAQTGTAVPAKILWTPATAGSSSYTYTMQFNYGTNVPQSSINQYVAGTPVSNTELLTSIEVLIGPTTVVKAYFIGYQVSPITGRKELISVQECADAAQSNCLAPTTVGWQAGAAGVGSGTALGGAVQNAVSAAFDLNGDGRNDLVMPSSTGTVLVAFGGSSGYGTPVATGLSSAGVAVGNIDGSGVDGLLVNVSGTWYYYKWNGSAFMGASTGISVATAASPVLVDVDGDGRADFVYTDSTGIVHVRLSRSTAGTVSFSSTDINSGIGASNFSISAQAGGSNRALHFWGGAQADLFGTQRTCAQFSVKNICVAYQYTYYALHFTGSTFFVAGLPSSAVNFADYNDDGCTDILTTTQLLLSACNGNVPVPVALPSGVAAVGGMDWDGDGRRDVLVAQSTGYLGVVLSTGTGLASTVINTAYSTSGILYTAAPNLTGDGQDGLLAMNGSSVTYYPHNSPGAPPDLLTSVTDGYGNSASPTYGYLSQAGSLYLNYTDAIFPYTNYTGPMYVVSQTTFSDASSATGRTYTQTMTYYGAWMNVQGRGFSGFNDIGNLDSRNGVWDVKFYRRDFPYTGSLSGDWISQPNTAATFSVKTNNTFAVTNLITTANNQSFFPHLTNSTSSYYELGGSENGDLITTASTDYTFDNYSNATNIVKTVTDNDPGSPYTGDTWTTNTTNTPDISVNPSTDLAAWCLNMLVQTRVVYTSTLAGSTSVTRTKTFAPDIPANCRIVSAVTEPTANSGLYKVTEGLTFDSFGNIQTDTVTGANMPSSPASRVTTFNWGTTGQFMSSITDPSGATSGAAYSSNMSLTFGVPDSVTNANNLTTLWSYDAFGRKKRETRPDGTSTTWTWSTCTSFCGWSNSFYQIAQTAFQTNGTAIRTDSNFYDPVDRVTQTSGPTVTGSAAIVQKLYNSLGLLAQQSLPRVSGATAYQQSYAYDGLNRLTSLSRPISSTNPTLQSTTYAYAGRKRTVSDPYGNTKTTITDINGWLRQTKDAIGYNIVRAFDAAGSLIGITDSVGNTLLSGVTYAYGLKPFRTASTDADLGAWVYTVDSLGERTGWTDAKGQSFSETYDALSRPLTRTEPDLFTQWTWGSTPASHNVGQLIAECTQTTSPCSSASALYRESRMFDAAGRPSTRAITESGNPGNDPGGVFLFTSTYSPTTGLPSTLTYPISTSGMALNIQYGYQNGLLQSVTDTTDTTATCGSTCTLWTANAENGFGEITQETLGNGVVTNRSYDAVTSLLSAATAGVGGGAALLNQSYVEDENGNITQRQDNNKGLTENFFYDADQRLTCTSLTSGCSTPAFAYDGGVAGPGNITSQTGVGTYTYPVAGQPRPHAVTSLTGTFNGITNPSFAYDANGNMTNRASSTPNIAWSSYNYPIDISATDATGAEEVQLSYGPDRQRWKQIYTGGPTGTETTYYIGGLVDLVFIGGVANYRHYIYAGGETVAVYNRTAAGNTMSYTLEDHQGGVSTIASNSGTADVNESFSAFGNRRNPVTWSGASTTADLNTIASLSRQGYTFQTWLGQSMGLNHMNGRVEDAILGRFLSPDPHIPDPTNAQSYNRYSYVNNNPLTETDPTGFFDKSCPTDGGCSGGSSNWNAAQGAQWSWSCYGNCGGGGFANSIPNLAGLTAWFNAASGTGGTTATDTTGSQATASDVTTQSGGAAQSQDSGGPSVGAAQSQMPQVQTVGDGLDEVTVTAQRQPDNGAAVSVLGPESLLLLAPALEEVTVVAMRSSASAAARALGPSGNIFGRARLGGSSIFGINSNQFLRIGWGWVGSATEGTNVFRISGDFIDWLGVESGHIDLFTWPP